MSYVPSDHALSGRQVIAAWLLCGLVAVAGVALAEAGRDDASPSLAGAEDPAIVVALDHNAVWARTAALGETVAALPRRIVVVPQSPRG